MGRRRPPCVLCRHLVACQVVLCAATSERMYAFRTECHPALWPGRRHSRTPAFRPLGRPAGARRDYSVRATAGGDELLTCSAHAPGPVGAPGVASRGGMCSACRGAPVSPTGHGAHATVPSRSRGGPQRRRGRTGRGSAIRRTRGGQGFDFLVFHHRKVESWKWRGRFYLQRWPLARASGVPRDKVRAATSRSRTERPVAAVVADLNPVLRGWAAYFRNGNSGRKFNAVDGYVHERLAIFASRKHGLAGRNWTTRYTYGWITRLGVYRLTGNVRGATAHASR